MKLVAQELKFPHKRQQAEFVRSYERVRALTHSHVLWSEGYGMMEVGSGYRIPGEASCCACFETRSIVQEVGGDHFQKLVRKSMGLSIHRDTCVT